MKRILLAYDSSEMAKKAYTIALDLSSKFKSELLVLSVAQPPEPPIDVETEAYLESAMKHYQQDFSHMKTKVTSHRIKAHFEILVGHPAQTIVSFADDNKVDLIITGSVKDKSFIQRWVLGSVSKQVAHYAHCSVMVVR
jgi:nucleotide-binding universal stress UspA family protein